LAQDKGTPLQAPAVRSWEEKLLRAYTGVYRWEPNAFVYLQLWNEFSGFAKPSQLVAFDESGEIRTLYPSEPDKFFAGPGAAVSTAIESRIEFQRDRQGKIASLRRLYSYDPAPTLQKLSVPVLALFGELDNNIVAEKNKNAWEAALKAGGNRDYTLRILSKANHLQFEAKVGNNAEMKSLQGFVPAYFRTIQDWLAQRIRGFKA